MGSSEEEYQRHINEKHERNKFRGERKGEVHPRRNVDNHRGCKDNQDKGKRSSVKHRHRNLDDQEPSNQKRGKREAEVGSGSGRVKKPPQTPPRSSAQQWSPPPKRARTDQCRSAKGSRSDDPPRPHRPPGHAHAPRDHPEQTRVATMYINPNFIHPGVAPGFFQHPQKPYFYPERPMERPMFISNDEPPSNDMLSFRSFLIKQDDSISNDEAKEKYDEYKRIFKRAELEEFFKEHKDEEWFQQRYHPDEMLKVQKDKEDAVKIRLQVFMDFQRSGGIDGLVLDPDEQKSLILFLDKMVILLEGGTTDDFSVLDVPKATVVGLPTEVGLVLPGPSVDTVPATADLESPAADLESPAAGLESPAAGLESPAADLELPEADLESPAADLESATADLESPAADLESETADLESPAAGLESAADDLVSAADDLVSAADDLVSAADDLESATDDLVSTAADLVSTAADLESTAGDHESPGSSQESQGEEEMDVSTDDLMDVTEDAMKVDLEVDPRLEIASPDREGSSRGAKGGVAWKLTPISKPTEQDETDRVDVKRSAAKPSVQLHRLGSLFIRSLPPSVTKQEVEALCSKFPGYMRVGLADPTADRRWLRRGWVTFENADSLREICLQMNMHKLRNCNLGVIFNRAIAKRVRPVSSMSRHDLAVKHDLRLAAQVVYSLDCKYELWGRREAATAENQPLVMQMLTSRNPLLAGLIDIVTEESSSEERELLGALPADAEDGQLLDDDSSNVAEVTRFLDRLLLYLRVVHSVDYYNCCEYVSEHQMPHRCGILHVRGEPAPDTEQVTRADLVAYCDETEKKVTKTFLQPAESLSDLEAASLGLKDPDEEVERYMVANTTRVAENKYVCHVSCKKFHSAEFVRKHIVCKHAEKLEAVRKNVVFFNNYLRDLKRPKPMDPAAIAQREATYRRDMSWPVNGRGFVPRMCRPAMPNQFVYYHAPYMHPRGFRGGFTRMRPNAGYFDMFGRPIVNYRDLDTPATTQDMF